MINSISKQLTSTGLKAFTVSFIIVFLMVVIPKLGLKINLISPQSSTLTPPKINEQLFTPLYKVKPDFQLKNSPSIIHTSLAAAPYQNSRSYLVVDFDNGQIIEQKNSHQPIPIASLTKLMSAVVALDLASPNDLLTVSNTSAQIEPTRIGVVENQKMTLDELLNASLITSANDATEVIKEGIDQRLGQDFFVAAMNKKAQFLGLTNTHFSNPQGYDNNQNYSSAQDLSLLAHYALVNYPLIKQIVQKDYQFLPADTNHKQFDLYNWNGLLGVYPGVVGLKIGNTDAAGYTTMVLSNRQGKTILMTLLGAPSVQDRDLWASQLLDLGYQQALGLKPVNVSLAQLKDKYSTWKYWH